MRVKDLRTAAGLTQEQLAKAIGVTQTVIAAWERGAYSPKAAKLPVLAAALGVTVNELFCEETGQDGGKETADGNEKADC